MKEFTHYILTKYNTMGGTALCPDGFMYDDPKKANKWMDNRMELFEACKESVLSQEGDFKWIISLDERTPKKYVKKIVTDDRISIVHCDIRDALKDEKIDTPWVITSRLDCDDQYLPGAIKEIQRKFRPRLRVIDIGFDKLDWDRDIIHDGYRRGGSMFISLVEPSSRVITAFCRPHGQVNTGYPMDGHWSTKWENLVNIEYVKLTDKLVLMVCHKDNITNRI